MLPQALLYTVVKLRSKNPEHAKSFTFQIRPLQSDEMDGFFSFVRADKWTRLCNTLYRNLGVKELP